MNTQAPLAGYIVEAQYWEQPGQNSTKSFIDADLLTARQAAHQFAQSLAAQKAPTNVLDVSIHLAEFNKGEVIRPYITQVFNHRFHRSQSIPEKDALQIQVEVDTPEWFDKSLPSTIDLTVDLTQVDEAFDSLEAVWANLGALSCEYEYLLAYGHSPGFGFMVLTIMGTQEQLTPDEDLSSYTVAELRAMRERIRNPRPKPFSKFFLIYDALPFAASLIGHYNGSYARLGEQLIFGLKPIHH